MLDTLTMYFTLYSKAVASNPVLAMFAVYVVGVLTFLLRSLPKAVWKLLVRNITTSLEINNAGQVSNMEQFNCFMKWFMKSPWARYSRTLHVGASQRYEYDQDYKRVYGPGDGRHFFFANGRLFWFFKEELPSTSGDKVKHRITIYTFGRKHAPIQKLIESFEYVQDPQTIGIYMYNQGWSRVADMPKRSFETVVIDEEQKNHMLERTNWFVNNKQWYRDKGLAYKLTNLFHGKPGTGKTALSKALSSHFARSLYVLDLSAMSNSRLIEAVSTIPPQSNLLIEDIDASTPAVKDREHGGSDTIKDVMDEAMTGLTLSGVLNVLDGVIPLEDVIVYLSTNHPELLDPALTRKSRIDHMYEIGYMKTKEIYKYISLMYPNEDMCPNLEFTPVPGCDVQAAFMEAPYSLSDFLDQLAYTTIPDKRLVAVH